MSINNLCSYMLAPSLAPASSCSNTHLAWVSHTCCGNDSTNFLSCLTHPSQGALDRRFDAFRLRNIHLEETCTLCSELFSQAFVLAYIEHCDVCAVRIQLGNGCSAETGCSTWKTGASGDNYSCIVWDSLALTRRRSQKSCPRLSCLM